MRVLHLCPTMHRVGTWYRCFFLARSLARRGHDVTLVKISPDARLATRASEEDGVHLIETPRFVGARLSHHNTRLPSDLIARLGLVARERFDVVHTYSHHLNAMLPGLIARRLLHRGALVADWDDLWTEGGIYGDTPSRGVAARLNYAIDHWSEVRLKRYADAVTVVSEDLRRRSVRDGVPAERIAFIPNGAAVDVFRPMPKEPLRKKLNVPVGLPVLVFVGYGQFDIDLVLDAVRLLRARGVDHRTVITGPHADATARAVHSRGLDECVQVAGLVPQETLAEYLSAADVGLLPYADKPLNRARWPIKLGDYLAAGLAIATCRVGEMGRVVQEWNVGVASEPTAEAYSRAIENLLRDADLPAYWARARAAAERLSWDSIAVDLETTYERAIHWSTQT